jgi:hypothetical protein
MASSIGAPATGVNEAPDALCAFGRSNWSPRMFETRVEFVSATSEYIESGDNRRRVAPR